VRPLVSLPALALLAILPIPALAQARPDTTSLRATTVTAVTLGTIYLGAGRNDGLREGSMVWIPRLGEQARYRVLYLSSKSAAARGDSLAAPPPPLPSVGDSVVFQPVAEVATGESKAAGRAERRARSGTSSLRGRIGVRYLGSWDRSSDFALRQPGLDLLLDGPVAPGSAVGVNLEVRSRRTSRYRPGIATTTSGVMGVYQAALRVQRPGGSFRAVVGRQYAPTLAGLGLFDGVLLNLEKPRWGAGIMAGLAPELGSLAVSSEIRQVGGFVQHRSRAAAPLRWSLSLGGIGSYEAGEVNREFGFIQATMGSRAFYGVVLQEVDINRGWKLEAGEPRFSLTSTFVSIHLTPAAGFSVNGGLDSRRNVRLYRDLATPEELFDDRFRRGYWGGVQLTIAKKLHLGGDVRTNTVESADSLRTTAWSGTMSVDQLTPLGVGLRVRGTRYETPGHGPGLLVTGGVRFSPVTIGSLEFNGGTRRETANPDQDRYWAGFDIQLYLHRSWFALATFTREWGRAGLTPTTDLLYGGLSYRF
jgi:hypothetical protein